MLSDSATAATAGRLGRRPSAGLVGSGVAAAAGTGETPGVGPRRLVPDAPLECGCPWCQVMAVPPWLYGGAW